MLTLSIEKLLGDYMVFINSCCEDLLRRLFMSLWIMIILMMIMVSMPVLSTLIVSFMTRVIYLIWIVRRTSLAAMVYYWAFCNTLSGLINLGIKINATCRTLHLLVLLSMQPFVFVSSMSHCIICCSHHCNLPIISRTFICSSCCMSDLSWDFMISIINWVFKFLVNIILLKIRFFLWSLSFFCSSFHLCHI